MMKKIILISIAVLLIPGVLFAAPVINGVSGTLADGETITVDCTGCGDGPTIAEWLGTGGAGTGQIDAGTPGNKFTRTGWTVNETNASQQQTEYSATKRRTGSKQTLQVQYTLSTQYAAMSTFDTGGVQSSWRISYWMKFTQPDTLFGGQWKCFRIANAISGDEIYSLLLLSKWYHTDGTTHTAYTTCSYDIPAKYSTGCGYQFGNDPANGPVDYPANEWFRIDIDFVSSSDEAHNDGTLTITRRGTSYSPRTVTSTTVQNHVNGRYVMMEHYLGNMDQVTPVGTDRRTVVINWDDLFIATGANRKAGIFLANASTLAAATHVEEQGAITTWPNFKLNQGSFGNTDPVYLIIRDSSGNEGSYSITLGGTPDSFSVDAALAGTGCLVDTAHQVVTSGGNASMTFSALSWQYTISVTGCDSYNAGTGVCSFTNVTAAKTATCTGAAKTFLIVR